MVLSSIREIWDAYKSINEVFDSPIPPKERGNDNVSKQPSPAGSTSSGKPIPGPKAAIKPCPLKKKIPQIPNDDCLYKVFGATSDAEKEKAKKFFDPLRETFDRYGLDNPAKKSLFLGQMKHETQNFTKFKEDADFDIVTLNGKPYSIKGMPQKVVDKEGNISYIANLRERKATKSLNKFTGEKEWRASTDAKKKGEAFKKIKLSADDEEQMEGSREDYFEYLNQHKDAPGGGIDNSEFYGRGAFHLTHYSGYKEFSDHRKSLGDNTNYADATNAKKLETDPGLICDSAGWFWDKKMPASIKNATSIDDVDKVSKKINSGDTNTFTKRKKDTENVYNILSKPECSVENK